MRGVIAVSVLAASCGGRVNELLTRRVNLDALHADHEVIYVGDLDHAWRRIDIATGADQPFAPAKTIATSLDGSVRLVEADDGYELDRGGQRTRVPAARRLDLALPEPRLSPDGDQLAIVEQPQGAVTEQPLTILVIATRDLATRPIASELTELRRLEWHGGHLWLETSQHWYELAPDAGTPAVAEPPAALATDETVCARTGEQLEVVQSGDRVNIVLQPFASAREPDRIAAAARVLVASESGFATTHWPHGGPVPNGLSDAFFTPSCRYFGFVFGQGVYVGEVATGRIARVARGSSAHRAPPGQHIDETGSPR